MLGDWILPRAGSLYRRMQIIVCDSASRRCAHQVLEARPLCLRPRSFKSRSTGPHVKHEVTDALHHPTSHGRTLSQTHSGLTLSEFGKSQATAFGGKKVDLILDILPSSSNSPISNLLRTSLGLDIWEVTHDHMIVRANAARAERLQQLGYRVEQLQTVADALTEFESLEHATLASRPADEAGALRSDALAKPPKYHSVESLNHSLHELAATHADFVELREIGRSVEDRPILALRIAERRGNSQKVLFLGCHHAREWISVEVPFLLAKGQGYHRGGKRTVDLSLVVQRRNLDSTHDQSRWP